MDTLLYGATVFSTPLRTHLIALELNNKTNECGKCADKGYASEGRKGTHTLTEPYGP